MQIKLSSDHYEVVASGIVFLFKEDKDLTVDITTENFSFSLSMYFISDASQEQRINRETSENKIILKCYNFSDTGTGLSEPVELAKIDGKKLYLSFWSYLEGANEPKARSVQYTIFYET